MAEERGWGFAVFLLALLGLAVLFSVFTLLAGGPAAAWLLWQNLLTSWLKVFFTGK